MTDIPTIIPSAEARLDTFPPKTAQPLRHLLRTAQISDDVVHRILDAAELANDNRRVLGFAAGYLHMRAAGVPVHDVIAMAKKQKRRINLAWSPNRWKEEHDRLSRAEALARLAGENIQYDVSAYQALLPARFPGYLIRSSRRLGMEGQRQRHCVASYHADIKNGKCAIAAVFVDKQRWTVQLEQSGDPEAPLRISQIKTRRNGLPPAEVRKEIHKILGIEMPKAPTAQDAADQRYLYMENLRRILPVLRANQIETVTVNFDGSGDSGSIDEIYYSPYERTQAARGLTAEHLATERFFDDGRWTSRVTPQQASLDDALTALTDDYLSETDINWYDGDGGYGTIEIDVQAGTVELNVYVRNIQTECEHSSCHNIETGEELDV